MGWLEFNPLALLLTRIGGMFVDLSVGMPSPPTYTHMQIHTHVYIYAL